MVSLHLVFRNCCSYALIHSDDYFIHVEVVKVNACTVFELVMILLYCFMIALLSLFLGGI